MSWHHQFLKFRRECFGPIFTCICCIRDLFKRSVEELSGKIEKKILNENKMHAMLTFDESLIIRDEFQVRDDNNNIISRKRLQTTFYNCRTCINYLSKKEMPPMCSRNYLCLPKLPDCFLELTNLEKQFIVKKLVFIKIRKLPKTRMEAMNDRYGKISCGFFYIRQSKISNF